MVATRKKASSGRGGVAGEHRSRGRPRGSGKQVAGKHRISVTRRLKTPRELQQIDIDSGRVLKTFLTTTAAAAAVNGFQSNISRATKTGRPAYGYYWKWIDVEK